MIKGIGKGMASLPIQINTFFKAPQAVKIFLLFLFISYTVCTVLKNGEYSFFYHQKLE